MPDTFSSKFFAGNRRALQAAVTPQVIALTANGLLQRSADSSFGFQQDSSFWYLTGINEPDITMVMTPREEFLIVPNRSDSRQAFDGAIDYQALVKLSGIATVLSETEGWERFRTLLRKHKKLATAMPADAYIDHYGLYANPSRRRFTQQCRRAEPGLTLIDLRPELARLRMVKQPLELKAMQKAIDITVETLADVTAKLDSYAFEYEVEADISHGFRSRGGRGHAFDPIVAGGKNAVTLHNVANSDALDKAGLLVMDVGAEYAHYAADITRTVSLGTPSQRQIDVFEAVKHVQAAAKKLVKPGIFLKDYEQQVEQLIGEQLRKLKLIDSDDRVAIRYYYPHAASHFLGLDVHDVGDYQLPLPKNAVITVEPGIYIPEEAIGVRLEDDVLVTANGCKTLSSLAPLMLQ